MEGDAVSSKLVDVEERGEDVFCGVVQDEDFVGFFFWSTEGNGGGGVVVEMEHTHKGICAG